MRWDDLTYTVKDTLKQNPRQVVAVTLLVVVGLTAVIVLGGAIMPDPEPQPDVAGLKERRTREDRQRVEAAQEQRRQEAERMRREVQAQGEDPNADAKRPSGG